jgi:hypothetical protein
VAENKYGRLTLARILFKERWFNSVRSNSWNETDFENLVISRADDLFPGWIPAKFKADVVGIDGVTKRPDLALIDPQYRKWCVVEVELAHHDLLGHVLPQIEVFCSGSYGEEHAQHLKKHNDKLDLGRMIQMMHGLTPEVLVVVDRPDTGWKKPLSHAGALLGIVEPFRGPNDEILLRINGDEIELPGEILTRCNRYLRRFWKVHSPATLPYSTRDDGYLEIAVAGLPVLWKRVHLANSVMLSVVGQGDAMQGILLADIVSDDDGGLRFVTVAKER